MARNVVFLVSYKVWFLYPGVDGGVVALISGFLHDSLLKLDLIIILFILFWTTLNEMLQKC